MLNRSLLKILPLLLLPISLITVQVESARSDVVQPKLMLTPKETTIAIKKVERFIELQRQGAITSAEVSNQITRLAQDHDHPTVTTFLTQLLKHEEAPIRSSAVLGLGYMHKSAKLVIPQLTSLLKDSNASVRSAAATGLGTIDKSATSAIPQLIPLLEDPDRWVRCSSAQSLGLMGEPAKVALKPLIRLLKDTDPEVRNCTAFALGKIEPFIK